MSKWTRFMDMHSGGGIKEAPYDKILIEAPESEARSVFYAKFGHSPDRVTCTCCGEDYSVSESDTLEEATAYDRNCEYAYFYTDTGDEAVAGKKALQLNGVEFCREDRVWKKDGREVEGRYVERPDLGRMEYGLSKKDCIKAHQTLEQYLESDCVRVIYADEIQDYERTTTIPREGYVWMD